MTGFISSSARAQSKKCFATCKHYAIGDETGPLDTSHFTAAMDTTAKLNADGFRVVAVAYKEDAADADDVFSRR